MTVERSTERLRDLIMIVTILEVDRYPIEGIRTEIGTRAYISSGPKESVSIEQDVSKLSI